MLICDVMVITLWREHAKQVWSREQPAGARAQVGTRNKLDDARRLVAA